MITFPGCKINLGLNITGKLPNGYHTLESVFIPLRFSDVLEVVEAAGPAAFYYTGISIPGDPEKNLVKKAYELICDQFRLPPVKVYLHKAVPMGGGLGGGSADAAAMLKLLNRIFELGITPHRLANMAGTLGADCPFFIMGRPAFVTGTGEQIAPFDPGLSGKKIVLADPGIHISTAGAFEQIRPHQPETGLEAIMSNHPPEKWRSLIRNDFEKYVFEKYPLTEKLKISFYKAGALYASMTGSGSIVYGIFEENSQLPENLPEGRIIYTGVL